MDIYYPSIIERKETTKLITSLITVSSSCPDPPILGAMALDDSGSPKAAPQILLHAFPFGSEGACVVISVCSQNRVHYGASWTPQLGQYNKLPSQHPDPQDLHQSFWEMGAADALTRSISAPGALDALPSNCPLLLNLPDPPPYGALVELPRPAPPHHAPWAREILHHQILTTPPSPLLFLRPEICRTRTHSSSHTAP